MLSWKARLRLFLARILRILGIIIPLGRPISKVLFCDLDGTLIVTRSGNTFPMDENDWEFKYGIKEAIQKYNPSFIFIISNQGGIEKGYVNEKKFALKFDIIKFEIRTWGTFVVDGMWCASNDPKNPYRKPNTGMLDLYGWSMELDTSRNYSCLMIGDASGLPGQFSDTDLKCAINAGINYMDVDEFIRRYGIKQ